MMIVFSKSAFVQLSKFEKAMQARIINKLEFYGLQSNPLEFAEKLSGSQFGDYRFRIGEFRVLFDINKEIITILKIGHRREVYK